jgi:hypothetical protein
MLVAILIRSFGRGHSARGARSITLHLVELDATGPLVACGFPPTAELLALSTLLADTEIPRIY